MNQVLGLKERFTEELADGIGAAVPGKMDGFLPFEVKDTIRNSMLSTKGKLILNPIPKIR